MHEATLELIGRIEFLRQTLLAYQGKSVPLGGTQHKNGLTVANIQAAIDALGACNADLVEKTRDHQVSVLNAAQLYGIELGVLTGFMKDKKLALPPPVSGALAAILGLADPQTTRALGLVDATTFPAISSYSLPPP